MRSKRWIIGLVTLTGAVVALIELIERRVLAGIDASSEQSGLDSGAAPFEIRRIGTSASGELYVEERGIGRPSTYVSVIETILARDYVFKKGTALVPTWKAFAKVQLLERHFAHLIDYDFTATMEEALDAVAAGLPPPPPRFPLLVLCCCFFFFQFLLIFFV